MSPDASRTTADGARSIALETDEPIGPGAFRLLALGCVLVLTASYVSVLQDVTRVVGGTQTLLALVGGMLLAATILARAIRPRTATLLAVVAAGLGFGYYLERTDVGIEILFTASDAIEMLAVDVVTLLTGLELLRMVEAGIWTLGFVPGPVFLSWYLALRGRYGLSVLPGGFALLFLVLTGDAGTAATLVGILAALGAVAFGDFERRGGSVTQADLLAVLFAVIVALSLSVTFVPGGASTGGVTTGAGGDGTLEGAMDSASERSGIAGQVDLSPEVRFTVESTHPSYWRTGVYDRYTGDEWVRTGQSYALEQGVLAEPSGTTDRMRQTVTIETDLGVLPAAAEPVYVDGDVTDYTEVSSHGHIQPATTLIEGDAYTVESAVVDPSPAELQTAGTEYPDEIEDHYLQTPETLSEEFEERTESVTDGAETPYETANAIETYLRSSKAYSLEVERPAGDVAEAFLFEMDEGYCVYFATTMAQMLRTEGVPARYVTGYTSGEQDGNEFIVRGTDAHAWVEVYFPDQGWVTFEPTPPQPREEEHTERLADARQGDAELDPADVENDGGAEDDSGPGDDGSNESDSDGDELEPSDSTSNETDGTPDEADPQSVDATPPDLGEPNETVTQRDEVTPPVPLTRELLVVASVFLVGAIAAVHRVDATVRARRLLGRYWQRRTDDPDRDAERAFRRLESLLGATYRPRRPGESARGYVRALADEHELDPRTERVVDRYEQAVYGGGVGREEADRAIELVDELARNRLPLAGRSRN
ncbi:DUF3488 and transglutaminase-like domain-containing protein [Natronobacterium gregoryi]|uniref:DUF4129 domain-containing protein n=2 Tax=Natronobacterium gregoryi TaxID=44930 RepID=L0AH67_NATGS|nr:DUF3488 and transglutaminase-like domain-containing protein [Natronobacterium gregoryi]AFZ73238.1 transglutaminase-like enzyme, predicted cysteine protease [Natronobacterium gregoryi SP2]ELY71303.1 transglutaminase [Natronobacterium gregoryi SP2]PLK21647.1 DUF4129 domain-containing protein [Natronobacterium gregoryi SP2]SFI57739.1 protein of unknown function [Natronobacterium gregoryi]